VTTHSEAAVLRERGAPLVIEPIEIDTPRPDEVVVRLVSAGICRSDEHAIDEADPPAVFGHEGAGVVEEVGSAVRKVVPGDHVVMTFASCGRCPRCLDGQPAYCDQFLALNFSGARLDGTSALASHGRPISGHFLGQSCFARHALALERSVVRVADSFDLRPIGPFGCGFQSGAGAVLNALRPRVGSSIAVFGTGAVGIAAVAAAAVAGCAVIAGIDVAPSRLDTAKRFGATHVIDSRATDAVEALRAIESGFDFAIDATGNPKVLSDALSVLNTRGTLGVIGIGSTKQMSLDWRTVLNGRTVTGIIAGNSVPDVFLPKLLALYWSGRFPADELLDYFSFEEINRALEASNRGESIKSVITFE
jgi:aryl-alcohol dehydrogenase